MCSSVEKGGNDLESVSVIQAVRLWLVLDVGIATNSLRYELTPRAALL